MVAWGSLVEQPQRIGNRLLDHHNRFRLALRLTDFLFAHRIGTQNRRFLFRLGAQNLGFLVALGYKNFAGFLALGAQDALALLALSLHLLLHRILNFSGRQDVFQLDPVDLNAPLVCRGIENRGNLGIDDIA